MIKVIQAVTLSPEMQLMFSMLLEKVRLVMVTLPMVCLLLNNTTSALFQSIRLPVRTGVSASRWRHDDDPLLVCALAGLRALRHKLA